MSLARTSDGSASAVEAARDLAAAGGVDLPADGWTSAGSDPTGQLVMSGRAVLHAVQGDDGKWFIDSGRCA